MASPRSLAAQLGLAAACICGLAHAGPATAQVAAAHYQTLLVGDRSMGLGTAFTGLANDGSAVYYNPAGLVFQTSTGITGGFWLTAFEKQTLEGGLERDFGSFNLQSKRQPSFPAFVSSSMNLGPKDAEGRRRYVLALSSFRVRTEQFTSTTDMYDSVVGEDSTFQVSHDAQDTYIGLTLASRARRVMGTGLSVFLAQRKFSHSESSVLVTGKAPFDVNQSVGTTLLNQIRMRSYLFVVRFGMLKAVNPRLTMGLMVQLPGVPLKSRANRRFQLLRYNLEDDPAQGSYTVDVEKDLHSRSPIPPELRAGTAWRIDERFTWTHDLSVVVPLVDRDVIDGQSARANAREAALFVVPTTTGIPVVNVSTGLQARLSHMFYAQVGAFTDFASSRRLPSQADVYQAPALQRFGITTSVGIQGKNRGMAIGLSAVLGRGRGLAAEVNSEGELERYIPTSIRTRTLFFSLTGAIETAEQIARVAAEKVAPRMVEGAGLDVPPAKPSKPAAAATPSPAAAAQPSAPAPISTPPGASAADAAKPDSAAAAP